VVEFLKFKDNESKEMWDRNADHANGLYMFTTLLEGCLL
jgi:hypothetical protein